MKQTLNIAFPFTIDSGGRTAQSADAGHVDEMIEQLLFCDPGERVNRPDFGSGMRQLVFAPNSPELAATVQFTMQAALQRYLGDLIQVLALNVTNDDSALQIYVEYLLLQTNQTASAQFTRSV